MKADYDKLSHALAAIGRDEKARRAMLEGIRAAEAALAKPGINVRDDVTGPVIDALFKDSGLLSVRLEHGLRYHFRYRSKIAREIVMNPAPVLDHLWEPQLTKLVLLLGGRTRHHALIGGAYAGDHAILLAHRIAGQGGVVHCFEPNGENASLLRLNARENRLANIAVNELGLWESADARLVLVGDDSHAHAEPARGGEEGSFPTTSIDAYGARSGVERLDFILLDIEGAELAALKGAARYLAQPPGIAPNIIFEVHASYVDWSGGLERTEILRYVAGHGYTVLAVRDYTANVPMPGQPIELIEPQHAYLEGPPHGFNMVAVKEPALLEGPMFRRRSGVSPKLLFHRDPKLHAPIAD
jgi:FkbM family methyltransferase